LLYTLTGAWNLRSLRRDAALEPAAVYVNSIMAWSALSFGPAQLLTDYPSLKWRLLYGEWCACPNFGWGVEWGLQLLGPSGSGWRAAALMAASIASYGLKFAWPSDEQEGEQASEQTGEQAGFLAALLPQVAAAILMCVVCFHRYRSRAAGVALARWVTACALFLVLHEVEALLPEHVVDAGWFEPARSVAAKVCFTKMQSAIFTGQIPAV
jgi:hypothetical protein